MKILSVMQAQSMRVVRVRGEGGLYFPSMVVALAEKYKFVGLPSPNELVPSEPNKAVTFRMGKYQSGEREIAIDFLQIYPSAIAIGTLTNTNDSDLILDDALTWSADTFKIEFEPVKPGIVHNSQLEVHLEKSLADLFPILAKIGAAITSKIDEFWETRPPYELMTLNFWFDKTKFPVVFPPAFRLDRREGVSFEKNWYWAEAPLTTDNHAAVLSMLERICIDALRKR